MNNGHLNVQHFLSLSGRVMGSVPCKLRGCAAVQVISKRCAAISNCHAAIWARFHVAFEPWPSWKWANCLVGDAVYIRDSM